MERSESSERESAAPEEGKLPPHAQYEPPWQVRVPTRTNRRLLEMENERNELPRGLYRWLVLWQRA